MNTDELPPEELQRLVDNNKELQEENDVSNIDHEVKSELPLSKKELIDELNEKDKIFELLVKSNNELKNKIEISNKKYQDILNKIETKKNEDIERKLNLQIKEIEKEIKANNSETERYKKLIDQLKTKIEFKENLERASSIQYILKQETLKNKDLQNELNALKRINKVQSKYIDNYDKENQITEKLDMLKNEIIFGSDNQNWQKEILYENMVPQYGYNKNSRIFNDLIRYMTSLNKDEQKKFLIFTTGASRLPVGGFKALSPKLTVVKKTCNGNENPDHFLPTVMTCKNNLKIPDYSSFEVFKEKFNLAMNEGTNEFHLS